MDLGLTGKRALVLGGNRGIGFGIARALAREGADVLIAARDPVRLAQAVDELQASASGKIASVSRNCAKSRGRAVLSAIRAAMRSRSAMPRRIF